MSTPPHTCQAVAMARLPTKPRFCSDNLPPGHGIYISIYYLLVPGCAQIDINGAQTGNTGAQTDCLN